MFWFVNVISNFLMNTYILFFLVCVHFCCAITWFYSLQPVPFESYWRHSLMAWLFRGAWLTATALLNGKGMFSLMSSFHMLLKATEVAYKSIVLLNWMLYYYILGRYTFYYQKLEASERQIHYWCKPSVRFQSACWIWAQSTSWSSMII